MSSLRALPTHIPLLTRANHQRDPFTHEVSGISVECSCGVWGPYVAADDPLGPAGALALEHGAPEPAGCADCGHVNHLDPTAPAARRPAWVRYTVIDAGTESRYVCHDEAACHLRQLALEGTRDEDSPLAFVLGAPSTFTLSTDLSGEWAFAVGLREAIANFQHVAAQAPTSWDRIGPADRRVATALISAIKAVRLAADAAEMYAPLVALKAGAGWSDIALATGDWSAEECRADYLQRVECLDWVQEFQDEITALIDGQGAIEF